MDFARKQMEKYGWKEGQGLGKDESGISNALKPHLKFDNAGLGFDVGAEFTDNWWETLYNKATSNIVVNTEVSGHVRLSQVEADAVDISNKSYRLKKNKKGVEQSFVKTSKIVQGSVIDLGAIVPEKRSHSCSALTDEELFNACGGRTAHKGARHGLNLSGKLARIDKQEKMLLKQMRRVSLNDEDAEKVEKKVKKLEKHKTTEKMEKKDDEKAAKKKKKKKRKSVSFNEVICEVIRDPEVDSSFNSEDRLGYESSPTHREPAAVDSPSDPACPPDEGIEQDCPDNSVPPIDCLDDHRSFEESQLTGHLSKAEKKLRMRATQRFLKEMQNTDTDSTTDKDADLVDVLTNKRKKNKAEEDIDDNRSKCKNCYKKSKKERKQEKKINNIAKELDQVCKISGAD